MNVLKNKGGNLFVTDELYIDITKDFVMRCTVPVNTGACLSPKDELAQKYLRIRHVQRIEIDVSQL